MDPTSFDRLTQLLSNVRSRRRLGGLGLGLLGTLLGVDAAEAAPCPKGKKRCKRRCIAKKRCCTNANCKPGVTGRVCRKGHCVCPGGRKRCRNRCILNSQCCQDGDCAPTQSCAAGTCVARACGAGGPCLAFVTSETRSGDIGGIIGGNDLCQSLATTAGLPGTYLAWLSDSGQSPTTTFVQSTGPYVRVDGAVIAASFAALISSGVQTPLNIDEEGTDIGVTLVWTGTLGNGTWVGNDPNVQPDLRDCDGWEPVTAQGGSYGQSDLLGSSWTEGGQLSCALGDQPIYCFQQS